jgi:hypothetical protein
MGQIVVAIQFAPETQKMKNRTIQFKKPPRAATSRQKSAILPI